MECGDLAPQPPVAAETGSYLLVADPLPGGQGIVLVVKPERPGRKPPLGGTAERSSPAPAVGVATTLPIARIMDPLEDTSCHSASVTLSGIIDRTEVYRPGR